MAGSLRKLTTEDEIHSVLERTNGNETEAAKIMSDLLGKTVSQQVFNYWVKTSCKAEEMMGDDKAPKVLIFDIESSPLLVYSWGLFNQNIPIGAIVEDWKLLCWSAKWFGTDTIFNSSLPKHNWNESEVVRELWELLDEADYVVAHNAKRFDVKKMNAKFLEYEMPQPSYYRVVDTLQIVKGNFALTSNKLDWVATHLGKENKNETNFKLWEDCMNKDMVAWKTMVDYCDQDVNVLEQVYIKIMPWDKRSPQYYTFCDDEEPVCKVCGSEIVETSSHTTAASTFPVFSCVKCGHNMRSRKSVKDKSEVRMVSM